MMENMARFGFISIIDSGEGLVFFRIFVLTKIVVLATQFAGVTA